jgi:hypothetical protein
LSRIKNELSFFLYEFIYLRFMPRRFAINERDFSEEEFRVFTDDLNWHIHSGQTVISGAEYFVLKHNSSQGLFQRLGVEPAFQRNCALTAKARAVLLQSPESFLLGRECETL